MSEPNPHQTQIAAKLDVIDKWGKILTVITVAIRPADRRRYTSMRSFVGRAVLGA